MPEKKELLDLLEPEVKNRVLYFANKYNIKPILVIQNIIISHWAKQAAEIILNDGVDAPILMPEFEWSIAEDGTKQLITGETLFNILVETYKAELNKPQIKCSTFSHLPDDSRQIMETAQAEALKNPSQGQSILQTAVNQIKALRNK